MFYDAPAYLFQYAKELRLNPTKAEKMLWEKLRNKQFGIEIIRFTNSQVQNKMEEVIKMIQYKISLRTPNP